MKKLRLSLSILLSIIICNQLKAQTWNINGNTIINTPKTGIIGTDANSNINNLMMLYNGQEAMAISQGNPSIGYNLSIGNTNTFQQFNNFAIGYRTTMNSTNCFSIGLDNTIGAIDMDNSYAIGTNIDAPSNHALFFALGRNIYFDNGRNAGGFVIGTGVDATTQLQACDEPNSLSIGFNSDIPTLFVGASAGRKTTGNVGIGDGFGANGTNQPSYKLDVHGTFHATMASIFDNDLVVGHDLTVNNNLNISNALVAPNITASNNVTAGNTISGPIGIFNNKITVLNNAYIGSASSLVGAKFEVSNNTNALTQFIYNPTGTARLLRLKGGFGGGTQSLLQIEANNTSGDNTLEGNIKFKVQANGCVLLNSTTPEAVFHIQSGYFGVNNALLIKDPNGVNIFKVDNGGNTYAKKIMVVSNIVADYVFEKNYHLLSVPDLDKYVRANHHLPNVPSAGDIKNNENQIDVASFQMTLLEKVEELTLYIIQQQKEIEALKEAMQKNK